MTWVSPCKFIVDISGTTMGITGSMRGFSVWRLYTAMALEGFVSKNYYFAVTCISRDYPLVSRVPASTILHFRNPNYRRQIYLTSTTSDTQCKAVRTETRNFSAFAPDRRPRSPRNGPDKAIFVYEWVRRLLYGGEEEGNSILYLVKTDRPPSTLKGYNPQEAKSKYSQ